MGKISKEQMEKFEERVILSLAEDGDQTISQISEKLGATRQRIWRYINNIEDNGKLLGRSIVFDENAIGREIYFINFQIPATKDMDSVVSFIEKKCKDIDIIIRDFYITSYKQQIHLKVLAKSTTDIMRLKNEIIMLPGNVQRLNIETDNVYQKVFDCGRRI